MLQKRRMIASIPDGLCTTAAKIRKGRLVMRKYNAANKRYELSLPTSADTVTDVYGFMTLRIDEDVHKESYYDEVESGVKAVVYTLVPNESWGTTEFDGTLAVGDKCTVSTDSGKEGKIRKITSKTTGFGESAVTTYEDALFEVVAVYPAMGGYEEAMIDVRVL